MKVRFEQIELNGEVWVDPSQVAAVRRRQYSEEAVAETWIILKNSNIFFQVKESVVVVLQRLAAYS